VRTERAGRQNPPMPTKKAGFIHTCARARACARWAHRRGVKPANRQPGKIDRETVSRILSQREVAELTAQYRSQLLGMVPKAISVYEQALASDDERVRVAAATKILEGMGVLPKGGIEQTPPEPEREQNMLLFLGRMMEMMLFKHQRYGIPLPPDLNRLEEKTKSQIAETAICIANRDGPVRCQSRLRRIAQLL